MQLNPCFTVTVTDFKDLQLLLSLVQHAKKVISDSPGLVHFTIGLVNSVLNLPTWQVKFFKEFKSQRTVINPAHHWAS